jgi:serine/threonine protein kinase/tetratricopeptide (TPR) repeat protein
METQSIDRIFWDAAQIVSAEERGAYLDRACGDDVELRRQVEQLLAAKPRAESFLESRAVRLPATVDERMVSDGPGTVIGPYKLLEPIGEGGFGVVFMAEQQRPVRRKVALKVLKPGMDTRQVIARFEAERQALALMDHPHIARILDAGQTASGRPFFVMELVKGVPITDYCDQARLSVRARLELFVVVCRAVQHAHQKGIIHRDLKPSNVLVTLHDDRPVVKVIDFGIAKARGQALTEKTLCTGFTQLIGTPLYMAPEQAAMNGLDVDTRSDVYALGVLLYELLTGTTPFDKERLRTAAYDEVLRIIREEEPARPSARLRKDEGGRMKGESKATRATGWKRFLPFSSFILPPSSSQELDWVVVKALEKDRNRRYDSANALALDVERYLHDEPVQACPPSALYRLGKFARRHKTGLTVAGLVLLALAVPCGGAVWVLSDRAARSALTAQQVERALEEGAGLRDQGKWPEALGAARRAQGLLAGGGGDELRRRADELRGDLEMVLKLVETRFPDAAGGAEESFLDQAGAEAKIARAFREYGIDIEALDPAEAADRVRGRPIRQQLTLALDHWIKIRTSMPEGNRKANEALRERLLAVVRAADPDVWRNQVRDALARHDLEALRKLAASPRIAELPVHTLSLLGNALEGAGANQESVPVLRVAQQKYPDDAEINFQLGWALDHRPGPPADQDTAEVVRFYTVARALRPRNVALNLYLGHALCKHGKPGEAAAAYRRAVELNPDEVLHYYYLATARLAAGDREGYRGTCAAMLDQFGPTDKAEVARCVAWTLVLAEGSVVDPDRPVQLAETALRGKPTPDGASVTLGAALYRAGRFGEALGRLTEADAAAQQVLTNPAPYSPAYVWFFLAMTHQRLGQAGRAGEWLGKAIERAELESQDRRLPWTRRVTLQLLRREAEDLVLGRSG